MPSTIILCDINIDTTDSKFLSLDYKRKIKILENVLIKLKNHLNQLYFYTNDQPIRAIFTAPEYYFACSNTTGVKRQYTESEARAIEKEITELSKKYKQILIIPGTVAWQKKILPPLENDKNFMYRRFSTNSIYQELGAAEKLTYENYIKSKISRGIPSNLGTFNKNNYQQDYLKYYNKSRDHSLLDAREVIMNSDVVNNIGGGYSLLLVSSKQILNPKKHDENFITLKRNAWNITGYFIKNRKPYYLDLTSLNLPHLEFPNIPGKYNIINSSTPENRILIGKIANFCSLIDIPPNDARYKLRSMLINKKLDEMLLSRNTVYFYLDGVRRYKYHKRSDYQEVIDGNSNVYIPGIKSPIVKIENITFGVEICLDHNCGVLKKFITKYSQDYTINPKLDIFKNPVDVHLILSASVQNSEDNFCSKQNGYLIHSSSSLFSRKYQCGKQPLQLNEAQINNTKVDTNVNLMELKF